MTRKNNKQFVNMFENFTIEDLKKLKEELDNYYNNSQLGIMSSQELSYYANTPVPRTEQDILKDFEKLGYVNISNIPTFITLKNDDATIVINIKKQKYSKYINRDVETGVFTMQEHKLLNELFEVWGWI